MFHINLITAVFNRIFLNRPSIKIPVKGQITTCRLYHFILFYFLYHALVGFSVTYMMLLVFSYSVEISFRNKLNTISADGGTCWSKDAHRKLKHTPL